MERIKVITAPTEPAVTLTELRDYLRVDGNDEDSFIELCGQAAQDQVEKHVAMKLMEQEVEIYYDQFPNSLVEVGLVFPIQSVDKVEYVEDGNTGYTELEDTEYEADIICRPARIKAIDDSWPVTEDGLNKVKVTATVGYASQAEVPEDIKMAIKMVASHLFDNRGLVTRSGQPAEIPLTADYLLDKYKPGNY